MVIITKRFTFGAALTIALCAIAASPAFGAQAQTGAETFVIKERALGAETVTADRQPSAEDGIRAAQPPFRGHHERLPAYSAIVDETPNNQAGPEVINYATSVINRTPNELVLSTTISKVENDETLNRLASKVYMENGGPGYKNVTIFWFVGENPEPAAPWGRTDIAKGSAVYKVSRLRQ